MIDITECCVTFAQSRHSKERMTGGRGGVSRRLKQCRLKIVVCVHLFYVLECVFSFGQDNHKHKKYVF